MKKLKIRALTIASAALLAGCAAMGMPRFSGHSVTDATLRQDVQASISRAFIAQSHGRCHAIEDLDMSIMEVRKSSGGGIQHAREIWRAHGCGLDYAYEVRMDADPEGETDYAIRLLRP